MEAQRCPVGWYRRHQDEYVALLTRLQEAANGRTIDEPQMLPFALSQKVLNAGESILALLGQGLAHDANAVMRSVAEAAIFMAAAVDGHDFFHHFADMEALKQLKQLRADEKLHARRKKPLAEKKRQRKAALELQVQQLEHKRFAEAEELARKYGLEELYYTFFEWGSDAMHNMPATLTQYAKPLGGDFDGVELIRRPGMDYALVTINMYNVCAVHVLRLLDDMLGTAKKDEIGRAADAARADLVAEVEREKKAGPPVVAGSGIRLWFQGCDSIGNTRV
jgi:hypothetical protein